MDRKNMAATLIEIRSEDGAQLYQREDDTYEWLTGITRAKDVQVGDTGRLIYRRGPSYGLYFFEKEN
jgi:hypothetical protein